MEDPMKDIKVLGIDLAKNIFQLHGTDAKGRKVMSKRLSQTKLIEFMAQLPPCTVGIEACTGSHYWGRTFRQMGHDVKEMAPQFVKPYVRSNKNDRNDARAIAEAVTRPDMKFVPIKTIEQQDMLLIHRARALVVKQRTAQANQIRGLLADYGIFIPKGISHLNHLSAILDVNKEKLTEESRRIFTKLNEQLKTYNKEIDEYDREIEQMAHRDPICRELLKIEGIGPITASAAAATIGDAKVFKRGREVSAWLGLVPKQHSSGNTIRLLGISKRGDRYLRTLLIHGGRAVVKNCGNKNDSRNIWIANKKQRCGFNKTAVAVANKNARIIWAIMATGECYRKAQMLEEQAA